MVSGMAAGKIETFGDGTPFVPAGELRRFFAWVIDFLVYVFGFAVGFVVLAVVDRARDFSDDVLAISAISLLFVVPLLYGLFYTNGRGLGAVVTGTQLVRHADGSRIGAKGPWAMLVRTVLLPLLIIAVVVGGGGPGGSPARTNIDVARTRGLRDHADAGR